MLFYNLTEQYPDFVSFRKYRPSDYKAVKQYTFNITDRKLAAHLLTRKFAWKPQQTWEEAFGIGGAPQAHKPIDPTLTVIGEQHEDGTVLGAFPAAKKSERKKTTTNDELKAEVERLKAQLALKNDVTPEDIENAEGVVVKDDETATFTDSGEVHVNKQQGNPTIDWVKTVSNIDQTKLGLEDLKKAFSHLPAKEKNALLVGNKSHKSTYFSVFDKLPSFGEKGESVIIELQKLAK